MTLTSATPTRLALATMAALALALAMTTVTAGAATSAKPVISSVHVKAVASDARSVTVRVGGSHLRVVMACDLKASVCVRAQRTSRGRWSAELPLASGNNPVGVIARSGNDYLFARAR